MTVSEHPVRVHIRVFVKGAENTTGSIRIAIVLLPLWFKTFDPGCSDSFRAIANRPGMIIR